MAPPSAPSTAAPHYPISALLGSSPPLSYQHELCLTARQMLGWSIRYCYQQRLPMFLLLTWLLLLLFSPRNTNNLFIPSNDLFITSNSTTTKSTRVWDPGIAGARSIAVIDAEVPRPLRGRASTSIFDSCFGRVADPRYLPRKLYLSTSSKEVYALRLFPWRRVIDFIDFDCSYYPVQFSY